MTKRTFVIGLFSLAFVLFWVFVNVLSPDEVWQGYFSDTYGFLALLGGVLGLLTARSWGFFKSQVGLSLSLLSFGLLSQFLGQLGYSFLYYAYGLENAYPAFCEIFFVLSVPLYAVGCYYIAKASGFHVSLRQKRNKAVAFITPLVVLLFSYIAFIRTYDFSSNPLLNTVIEIYYPIGQSLFLSMSLAAFITTRACLGGIMKKPVLLILIALVFQYLADSMFIYETTHETWQAGSISALVFVISYALMSLALAKFNSLAGKLRFPINSGTPANV